MMRIAALVLAVLLPPAAIVLIRGRSLGFWLNGVGFVLAQALFWAVFAGPGFALWGLTIAHALLIALFFKRRGRAMV